MSRGDQKGFTLVELLNVFLIIGIIASIGIPALLGQREKAYLSQNQQSVDLLEYAVSVARNEENKVLVEITGTGWTSGGCITIDQNPNHTHPSKLPRTHACWVNYHRFLTRVSAASDINLESLRNGDVDGAPFFVDENEFEYPSAATRCSPDTIGTYLGGKIKRAIPGVYGLTTSQNRTLYPDGGTVAWMTKRVSLSRCLRTGA